MFLLLFQISIDYEKLPYEWQYIYKVPLTRYQMKEKIASSIHNKSNLKKNMYAQI